LRNQASVLHYVPGGGETPTVREFGGAWRNGNGDSPDRNDYQYPDLAQSMDSSHVHILTPEEDS
jgi:hypothetical protein